MPASFTDSFYLLDHIRGLMSWDMLFPKDNACQKLGRMSLLQRPGSSFCTRQTGGAPGLGIFLQWSHFWCTSTFRIPCPQWVFCPKLWKTRTDCMRSFLADVFMLYLHSINLLQYDCNLLWLIGVKMWKMQPAEIDVESPLLAARVLGVYGILIFWLYLDWCTSERISPFFLSHEGVVEQVSTITALFLHASLKVWIPFFLGKEHYVHQVCAGLSAHNVTLTFSKVSVLWWQRRERGDLQGHGVGCLLQATCGSLHHPGCPDLSSPYVLWQWTALHWTWEAIWLKDTDLNLQVL